MTAHGDGGYREESRSAGVACYLVKPLSPIDLVAAIGDAIRGRNSSNSSDAARRVPLPSDKE